jgi:hypothetical protein
MLSLHRLASFTVRQLFIYLLSCRNFLTWCNPIYQFLPLFSELLEFFQKVIAYVYILFSFRSFKVSDLH